MSKASVGQRDKDGCKVLAEPFINTRFVKFNSNSGHEASDDVCRALSHFSYRWSKGKMLLCDLQGGAFWSYNYWDKKTLYYVLTDPALLYT